MARRGLLACVVAALFQSSLCAAHGAVGSGSCDGATAGGTCRAGDVHLRTDQGARVFRLLRRLLAGRGSLPRRLLRVASVGDGQLAVFLRKGVAAGDILMEVPISHVIWRRSVNLASLGVRLAPSSLIGDSELVTLALAVLRRFAASGTPSGSDFLGYAEAASQQYASTSNSTLFWSLDELRWLDGTDAGDVTDHLLARLSSLHAAAPRAATLEELREAYVFFQAKHFRLPLSAASGRGERGDVALVPAMDLCRGVAKDGAAHVALRTDGLAVQMRAKRALKAGEEIVVEYGPRDISDGLVLGLGPSGGLGAFLPVPLDADMNGGPKAQLLERLHWPAEVRLVGDQVWDMKVLRLVAMPQEEFSAWNVGALAAGAPLAVSRAFRTEVQGTAYLMTECAQRHAGLRRSAPKAKRSKADGRLRLALDYRTSLLDTYGRCREQARTKLGKLQRWSQRQSGWAQVYVEEAIWRAEWQAKAAESTEVSIPRSLSGEPPAHVSVDNVDQRLSYASIVALVNTKGQEYVPFFAELLRSPKVSVPGMTDVGRRLRKIKRLAAYIVQLKGPSCGGVDLSAFEWINELRGEEDVFTTLKYLLPEMKGLVEDFVEMEKQGEVPAWR